MADEKPEKAGALYDNLWWIIIVVIAIAVLSVRKVIILL